MMSTSYERAQVSAKTLQLLVKHQLWAMPDYRHIDVAIVAKPPNGNGCNWTVDILNAPADRRALDQVTEIAQRLAVNFNLAG